MSISTSTSWDNESPADAVGAVGSDSMTRPEVEKHTPFDPTSGAWEQAMNEAAATAAQFVRIGWQNVKAVLPSNYQELGRLALYYEAASKYTGLQLPLGAKVQFPTAVKSFFNMTAGELAGAKDDLMIVEAFCSLLIRVPDIQELDRRGSAGVKYGVHVLVSVFFEESPSYGKSLVRYTKPADRGSVEAAFNTVFGAEGTNFLSTAETLLRAATRLLLKDAAFEQRICRLARATALDASAIMHSLLRRSEKVKETPFDKIPESKKKTLPAQFLKKKQPLKERVIVYQPPTVDTAVTFITKNERTHLAALNEQMSKLSIEVTRACLRNNLSFLDKVSLCRYTTALAYAATDFVRDQLSARRAAILGAANTIRRQNHQPKIDRTLWDLAEKACLKDPKPLELPVTSVSELVAEASYLASTNYEISEVASYFIRSTPQLLARLPRKVIDAVVARTDETVQQAESLVQRIKQDEDLADEMARLAMKVVAPTGPAKAGSGADEGKIVDSTLPASPSKEVNPSAKEKEDKK